MTQGVLAKLAERRLVTIAGSTAQVAHEALLREWPRLRTWLAEDRDGRRLHHQIAAAAHDWEAADRDEGAVLRGARLAAAEDWTECHQDDLTQAEQDYVAASLAARERELARAQRAARRFKLLALGLVFLLIISALTGGFALSQRETANQRAIQAEARSLASQAVALAGVSVDTSLLLAAEGYRRDPSIETESGLLSALNGARFLAGYRRELPVGIVDMALTPDRTTLVALTSAGTLQRYDTSTWRPVGPPLATNIEGPRQTTVSRDGRQAFYTGWESGGHLVSLSSGAEVGKGLGSITSGALSLDASDQAAMNPRQLRLLSNKS